MPAAGAVYDPAGYVVHSQAATSQQLTSDNVTPPLPDKPLTIDAIVAILAANGMCKNE